MKNETYDDWKCDKLHGVFCESESGKTNKTYDDKCDKIPGICESESVNKSDTYDDQKCDKEHGVFLMNS